MREQEIGQGENPRGEQGKPDQRAKVARLLRGGWIAALALLAAALLVLGGCSGKERLNIYSWSDYVDEDLIKAFEKEHNVKIKYDVFSNNEELLAKLQTGKANYDLVFPSDYMVALMIKLDLLEELDKALIPNHAGIAPQFQNPEYDPGNRYSLMYTWGVTGIAYNTKYVTDRIDSWDHLWDPKYKDKLILLDDMREIIGMSLIKNGQSNSSQNPVQLERAVQELKRLLPNVLAFNTENIKQKLAAEEAWIATVWSGDAAFIQEDHPEIAFVVPKEGSTIWSDNFAIPKSAPNKELAYRFINYLLEPEVSVQNFEYIGYPNPVAAARSLHDPDYANNRTIFLSDEELARTEWLKNVGETIRQYDRYWTELKSGR